MSISVDKIRAGSSGILSPINPKRYMFCMFRTSAVLSLYRSLEPVRTVLCVLRVARVVPPTVRGDIDRVLPVLCVLQGGKKHKKEKKEKKKHKAEDKSKGKSEGMKEEKREERKEEAKPKKKDPKGEGEENRGRRRRRCSGRGATDQGGASADGFSAPARPTLDTPGSAGGTTVTIGQSKQQQLQEGQQQEQHE